MNHLKIALKYISDRDLGTNLETEFKTTKDVKKVSKDICNGYDHTQHTDNENYAFDDGYDAGFLAGLIAGVK